MEKIHLRFWNRHCEVALTTKAATSVQKCRRRANKANAVSWKLSALEAATYQRNSRCVLCRRRLSSHAVSFISFCYYSNCPPWDWFILVLARVPHWGIKWQAASIPIWRRAECLTMCWRAARHTQGPRKSQRRGMKGAGAIAASGAAFTRKAPT